MSCCRGCVALAEEPGRRGDGSDSRKAERDEGAVRKRGWIRELAFERDRMSFSSTPAYLYFGEVGAALSTKASSFFLLSSEHLKPSTGPLRK
jgi:hypothetical protein